MLENDNENKILMDHMQFLSQPITVQEIATRDPKMEHRVLRFAFKQPMYTKHLINDPSCNAQTRHPDKKAYSRNIANWSLNDGCERYFDASVVKDPYNNPDSFSFIAGQAPTTNTYPAFARLLLTLFIPLIITIGERKDIPHGIDGYWLPATDPLADGSPIFESIKLLSDNGFARESLLRVQSPVALETTGKPPSNVNKLIWHMNLYTWVDNTGIQPAELKYLEDIFKRLVAFKKQFPAGSPEVLIFVHCSAGLGRTGTLIGAYYLYMEHLKAVTEEVTFKFSVFELVGKLRTMRYGAVLKSIQYKSLYNFAEYLVQQKSNHITAV